MASNVSPVYLLTAASGNIGEHLVPLLLSQSSKPTVILPTSNSDRLNAQLQDNARHPRIKVIQSDIKDPVSLESIIKEYGVTAVFVCLTGSDELMVTLNFFDALRRAETVKHLVYLSACGNFDLDDIKGGALRNVAAGHVVVKPIIEAKLRHGQLLRRGQPGGFSWTIIGPTLFFTNDLRSKQNILNKGFFDEPLGSKGASRVDPKDIALAVANALQDDGQVWAGKKIMVGSLETYSNAAVEKLWGDALGKEITAAVSNEVGLSDFEQHFRKVRDPVWARDMRLMYEIFEAQGFGMTEAEYQDQVGLLGKAPASYELFVRNTAEAWKDELGSKQGP